MRLVFMGTPDFAVSTLKALTGAGHEVACVYSQPPRPAGRGMAERPSPVHAFAASQGIDVRTPLSLRDPAEQARFAELNADAAVVVAYGLLLPKPVLDAPKRGCFNVHASLLPRWRGAAPIHRAIEAGDTHTGVTIMQMDAGLDTGDMLLTQALPISASETTASLHDQLARLGAQLIVAALEQAAQGQLRATPQPAEGITYAHKIDKAEAVLDWREPAAVLERRIRAFQPAPGASSALRGTPIKVWQAHVLPHAAAAPGTVMQSGEQGVDVATGQGVLRLQVLQKPGGKPLQAAEFLRGFPIEPGQPFDAKAPA
jgi:methionyl-tRNA formyltransferase